MFIYILCIYIYVCIFLHMKRVGIPGSSDATSCQLRACCDSDYPDPSQLPEILNAPAEIPYRHSSDDTLVMSPNGCRDSAPHGADQSEGGGRS